jgi:hypothetical protein
MDQQQMVIACWLQLGELLHDEEVETEVALQGMPDPRLTRGSSSF